MNQSVVEKAQELAQLIAKSPEYISMRAAEDAATQDEQLTDAFSKYEEKRTELENLTMQENPDYNQLGALSHELEELQASFNAFPMAQALQQARKGFTDMMNQVNLELQKVLAPEQVASEGCGGHCDGCSGCHH